MQIIHNVINGGVHMEQYIASYKKLEPIIKQIAKEQNVDETLICQIITIESSWNEKQESRVGARGLMQLMPIAVEDVNKRYGFKFTFDDMFNGEKNIKAGVYYIKRLLEDFDIIRELPNTIKWYYLQIAYNQGISKQKQQLQQNNWSNAKFYLPSESQDYILKLGYWLAKWDKVLKG